MSSEDSEVSLLSGLRIYKDSPGLDDLGYDLCEPEVNGEYYLVPRIISEGDTVFDVGASTGQWSRYVLRCVPNVNLYAFEPRTETFARLQETLAGSGSSLHNVAISAKGGSRTFFICDEPSVAELSSFYRRALAESCFGSHYSSILVPTQSLDSFCIDNKIERIDFLKVDTEGAELDVLAGAAGLLEAGSIRALQFEYGGTYADAAISLRQVCALLSEHGYVIFRVMPDGIAHVSEWRESLESYRYANYLAVSARLANGWASIEAASFKATHGVGAADVGFNRKAEEEVAPHRPVLARREVTVDHDSRDTLARIKESGLWVDGQPLRLHLGCGENHLDGYINIDYPPSAHAVQSRAVADLFADITELAFPPGSVDEIRLHHVFEHFGRGAATGLLIRWHEWLKTGGRLQIETPDILGCAQQLVSDASYEVKQAVLRHAFGSQEAHWANHLDGWYDEKLRRVLSRLGYTVKCRSWRWNHEPFLANVLADATKTVHMSREDLLFAAQSILRESMVEEGPGERGMCRVWYQAARDLAGVGKAEDAAQEGPADQTGNAGLSGPAGQAAIVAEAAAARCIAALVFSKDRAMQLDAALRSFYVHCTDSGVADVHVIYATSDKAHEAQYRELSKDYPSVNFIRECCFKGHVLCLSVSRPYIMFVVDDAVFISDFQLSAITRALDRNPDALGYSLRLGLNTNCCYMLNTQQELPEFVAAGRGTLKYDWRTAQGDFGYPLDVSSSAYRSGEILQLLSQVDFSDPNALEARLIANKHLYAAARPYLLCGSRSIAFCNPLNVVESGNNNRAARSQDCSIEALARRFEEGLRIRVEAYSDLIPESCHQEVALEFERRATGFRELGEEPAPAGGTCDDEGLGASLPREGGSVPAAGNTPSPVHRAQDPRTAQGEAEPKVSVVIITYNRAHYVADAVSSALSQTSPPLEVVVVDDGSTDRTAAVMAQFPQDRVRYVPKEHSGIAATRNRGLREARGEFILWLDSDDMLLPHTISLYRATLSEFPDVDVIYGDLYVTDARLSPKSVSRYADFHGKSSLLVAEMMKGSVIPNPGTLVRRHCFERVGGYDETYLGAEDYEWWTRLAGAASFKHAGANVVTFRSHGGNKSTDSVTVDSSVRVVRGMLERYSLRELYPDIDWQGLTAAQAEASASLLIAVRLANLHDLDGASHYAGRCGDQLPSQNERALLERLSGYLAERAGSSAPPRDGKERSGAEAGQEPVGAGAVPGVPGDGVERREEPKSGNGTAFDYQQALIRLSSSLLASGQTEEALFHLNHLVEVCPDSAEAHAKLGEGLCEVGQVDGAVRAYKRSISIDPGYVPAYAGLALLHWLGGEHEDAIETLRGILEDVPDSPEAVSLLGAFLLEKGDAEGAVTWLERSAALAPQDAAAQSKLGEALYQAGRPDSAEAPFLRALALSPQSADVHSNLAVLYWERGNASKAIQHIIRAVELQPETARFSVDYARMLDTLGEKERAVELLQRFLAGQDDEAVRTELDALQGRM